MNKIESVKNVKAKIRTVVLTGISGAGKSTQLRTVPKPLLVIAFDPKAKGAIAELEDTDIIEFLPDGATLDIPSGTQKAKDRAKKSKIAHPTAYINFNNWFMDAVEDGTLNKYATIALDSASFIERAIGEQLKIDLDKRHDSLDFKTDLPRIRDTFLSTVSYLVSLPANIIFLAHQREKTNQAGDVIGQEIAVVGMGRQLLPGFVDATIALESKDTNTGTEYIAKTRATGHINFPASVPLNDIPNKLDFTIHDWDKPEDYGLGLLLRGKWLTK